MINIDPTVMSKIFGILEEFADKHELDEGSALETYFQSDHVYIEGANETFPEILELFMEGKSYRKDE